MLLNQLGKICGGLLNVLGSFEMRSKIFGGGRVQVSLDHETRDAEDLDEP